MQGMSPGQRPLSSFYVISGFKYYIVLSCQDIFNVLETENNNKKCFVSWLEDLLMFVPV